MWFALLLAASPPLPTTCPQIIEELKMRPPAYGEKARAGYVWDFYLKTCEPEWSHKLDAEDAEAVSRVIQGQ
jgi:hypothetical protein